MKRLYESILSTNGADLKKAIEDWVHEKDPLCSFDVNGKGRIDAFSFNLDLTGESFDGFTHDYINNWSDIPKYIKFGNVKKFKVFEGINKEGDAHINTDLSKVIDVENIDTFKLFPVEFRTVMNKFKLPCHCHMFVWKSSYMMKPNQIPHDLDAGAFVVEIENGDLMTNITGLFNYQRGHNSNPLVIKDHKKFNKYMDDIYKNNKKLISFIISLGSGKEFGVPKFVDEDGNYTIEKIKV